MFVRWTRRVRRRYQPTGVRLNAILARTARINGKVRQQHVAFLGSILEGEIDNKLARKVFWLNVRGVLNKLALPWNERRSIYSALNEQVPREF